MVGGKKFVKTRGERPFGRSSCVPAERSRVPRIKIFLVGVFSEVAGEHRKKWSSVTRLLLM